MPTVTINNPYQNNNAWVKRFQNQLKWDSALLVLTLVASPVIAAGVALEEIIVTATKRSESSQDVGISLVAMSEESLRRQGFDSFSNFAASVPGLSFADRGPGQTMINIRGVATDPVGAFAGNTIQSLETVGIYLDGTPIALSNFNPEPRLFDINRVEVLRGPQGTLFGSGSLSGTIRYISNEPNLDKLEGAFSADLSDTRHGSESYEVNGMFNLPFANGKGALRATVFGRDLGGYIDNVAPVIDSRHPGFGSGVDEDVNDEHTFGGRIQLAWIPNDKFDLITRYYYQKTNLNGYPSTDAFDSSLPPGSAGNNPDDALLGDYEQNRLAEEGIDNEFQLFNLVLNYDFGFAELTSETSVFRNEMVTTTEISDVIPLIFGIAGVPGTVIGDLEVNNLTQELRLTSQGGATVDWVIGFFFNDSEKDLFNNAPFPGLSDVLPFPLPPTAVSPEDSIVTSDVYKDGQQYAFFGEAAWQFAEQWRAIVGFRYYNYELENRNPPGLGLFGSGIDFKRTIDEDGVTPKFSLEYRPAEDLLLYATATEGFRLGGIDEPIPEALCGQSQVEFEADTLWNYELGSKLTLNNNLQINLAAYYIEWEDVPISEALLACGFTVTKNAGEVEVRGVEGNVLYAVTDNLQVNLSFSYTDSKFSEEVPALNIPSDSDLPLVPNWNIASSLVYYFPVGSLDGIFSASYVYRGNSFNVADPTIRLNQDSYSLVGLRLGVESENWNAAIYADNVFDKEATTFTDTVLLFHNRSSIVRPRLIGVSLGYKF